MDRLKEEHVESEEDIQEQTQDDTSPKHVNGRKESVKGKIFNDPIHGTIEMHPACVCIIDTPQFQRLRQIKQLDTCHFVYPSACHTRFEHSIGVSYLAGKLLKTIREHQKQENITDRDILCVEIAGLCHDLGRGPFSYVFEKLFMKPKMKHYKHRKIASEMFKYMLSVDKEALKKKIQDSIATYGSPDFKKFEDRDFAFILEMIDEPPKDLERKSWDSLIKGRDENKSYMYEIVNNTRNGIDVDKWDYLARDSYMLGLKTNFDYNRCFASARVLESNGSNGAQHTDGNESNEISTVVTRKQICYRDKDAQGLYDMFYTEMLLTRQAYQHKTNTGIRLMMLDVLNFANKSIKFNEKTFATAYLSLWEKSNRNRGAEFRLRKFSLRAKNEFSYSLRYHYARQAEMDQFNGIVYVVKKIKEMHSTVSLLKIILETVIDNDMKAFTQLTDDILLFILYPPSSIELKIPSDKKGIDDARKVLNKILNRELYHFVGQTQTKEGKIDRNKCMEEIQNIMKEGDDRHSIQEGIFHIYIANLHYGKKNRDPLQKVRFYRKKDINLAIKLDKDQVSYVLPETFAEQIIRIYSKVPDSDPMFKKISYAFRKWCEINNHPVPKDIREENGYESTEIERPEDCPTNKPLVEPNICLGETDQQEGPEDQEIGGFERRPSDN